MTSRATETSVVKAALRKAGFENVAVRHGTGTAWGWLRLTVTGRMADPCECNDGMPRRCYPCALAYRELYSRAIRTAQEATGRHGEYDGDINVTVNLIRTREHMGADEQGRITIRPAQ